ncbi:MAG: acetyltransferase [Gammaproteobacteria bacterium BRH_c0]|nr:MAG: acetyltransferase [Gammaproteobacteria bacterium BRH_c0]
MTDYDIFNGDADGICSLVQLRLAEPRDAVLITGVKRDIDLLKQVKQVNAGDRITILDVSMDKNRADLDRVLAAGASVFYVDHHFPGDDQPSSTALTAIINEAADVCTSLLVDNHLKGAYRGWAIVGAFGDNLRKSALGLAKNSGYSEEELTRLEDLGIYINYNGYGSNLEDLHFTPEELYRKVLPFKDPLDFIRQGGADFEKLETGYHQDMKMAAELPPEKATDKTAVFMLPDVPWARRVSGVYSNDLANNHPDRAHAILTLRKDGQYLVSVRAPLSNKTGAVDLCKQFPTGGGRAAAAGINELPADMLGQFIDTFTAFYS